MYNTTGTEKINNWKFVIKYTNKSINTHFSNHSIVGIYPHLKWPIMACHDTSIIHSMSSSIEAFSWPDIARHRRHKELRVFTIQCACKSWNRFINPTLLCITTVNNTQIMSLVRNTGTISVRLLVYARRFSGAIKRT